jgi:heme A synthase
MHLPPHRPSQATATTPVKAPPGASRTRYLILGLAVVGLSLNYLDRANLSVALPFIQDDLHLDLSNAPAEVRKTVMVGGLLGGAAIVFAAPAKSVYVALLFLAISYASLAIAATGIWSLPGDVAPSSRHVAPIGGIQNFAGIISPFVFGLLLDLYDGS